MSLDVYLESPTPTENGSGIFIREDGRNREITRAEWNARFPGCEPVTAPRGDYLYHANITHNLGRMAREAGIYGVIWRPDESEINYAEQLIAYLENGLFRLKALPDHFKQFNPSNGWGDYGGLVEFVTEYLNACKQYPTAHIQVSR